MAEFDLASLGTVRSDEGVPMPLIHPRSRQAVTNDDGTPVTITLLGRQSEPFRETLRLIQLTRAELQNRGQVVNADHLYHEDTQTLCACTIAWTIQKFDGAPFPFNGINARKLWENPHFRWLRDRAMNFLMDDGNFLAIGSTNSSDTHDTTFDFRDRSPPEA